MYTATQELLVHMASLPWMKAAKSLAESRQMNDHGPLHAQRVRSLAATLGCRFNLSQHERDLLSAACLLHDIGMAKDREEHHRYSRDLVCELAAGGKLPFDAIETEVVSTLCEWHRKTYDPSATHAQGTIRTGLLASLLRLADALDIDYRRSDDYLERQPLIHRVNPQQEPHHDSVRRILAPRLFARSLETRIQVLVEDIDHAQLQLSRLVHEVLGTPIRWPVEIIPLGSYTQEHPQSQKRAIIYAYCNPHGLVVAAMSKRQLASAGVTATVICSYQETGYPDAFWQNALPRSSPQDYDLAIVLGLHASDEGLQHFLEVVRACRESRWLLASPLERSHERVEKLTAAGVEILLADERVLFAGTHIDDACLFWSHVAGLCNYDDPLVSETAVGRQEYLVVRGLRYALWQLINAKAEPHEYTTLIDRIEADDRTYFEALENRWAQEIESRTPHGTVRGRVVVLDSTGLPGRLAYDCVRRAAERQGLLPYEDNEFATPYVIFKTDSSRGFKVLFHSHFSHAQRHFPIKYFVEPTSSQLGTSSAIWQTFPTASAREAAIEATIERINEHFK